MMTLEEKQTLAVCWCICHKVKGEGFIMKHGLTCNQCMEICFKKFESKYMEYRCEKVKPPEAEEYEYDYEVSE
jgi:hypothetical protein